MNYLIAFMGRPMPSFLAKIVELSAQDGVTIQGALLTEGPGCYNLGIILPEQNDKFAEALTMALMPAKYCTTTDPQLKLGEFIDRVNVF